MHGDDLIVFPRIYDIYHSVNHNPCYRAPSSWCGLRIIHALTFRCDAIRVRLRRQPSDGVALSPGKSVGERSSRIADENRRSSAGGAVDRDGARTRENGCARGPSHARRSPHAGSRVAAPKGDAKFSCLQRIEKAQNGEILSMAEDGLGATQDLYAPAAPPSARGAPRKNGRGNFPACNPLKRRKTWKCSR
jgi:hypothetical protein